MNEIVDEALEEAVGGSSKRWALLLVAFVLGVVVALCLARRLRGGPPEVDPAGGAGSSGAEVR